ncbi:MAG: tandem-95 repeat protein [Planctomyces sp.]
MTQQTGEVRSIARFFCLQVPMIHNTSSISRLFQQLFPAANRRLIRRRSAVVEKLEQRQLLVGDINGQIWVDTIANGRNDPGDRSLPGWPVFIDSSGDGLLTPGEPVTATDANGKYLFTGLTAGNVRVATIVQPGFSMLAGRQRLVTVAVRDRRAVSADFPVVTAPVVTGRVTGTIFSDLNENGIKDADEGGISGWTVFADYNSDGFLTTGEPTAVANADGDYILGSISAGTWPIYQIPVGGYRTTAGGSLFPLQNAPNFKTVSVVVGGTATASFGNWIPSVGTISGTVWNDSNGDGVRGTGETALAGRPVFIDLNRDGVQAATEPARTTDANGNYVFTNIRTGAHRVTELLPAGFIPSEGRPAAVESLVVRAGTSVVDFFNLQPVAGSLSGTIWNDLNGDGIFGTGEPPLAGWTVYVDLNSDGSLTAGEPASVTAGAGTWAFPSQAYGTKTVRVIPQPNWAVTSPATGSATFLLLNGQARTAVNFGLRELVGDVRGVVVDDANGNGIQDAGELPLSDQTVFADLNNDGLLTAGEPAAVTAADGSWLISRLPSGTRSIVHQLPAGRIPSIGAPAVRSLSVGIGTTSVADFFTLIPTAGSVAGRVFSDVASDGIFNAGDAPLEGWQVFADLNANTVFDAGEPNVLSAADGSYLLSGLAYGPVTIRQTMLPGFTATTFPSGAAILLLNGENRTGISFGRHDLQQYAISGNVFSDVNRNGIRDAGERGLSGVTIYLDLNNNSVADPGEPVTTSITDYYFTPAVDETGDYSFTHLGHGTYLIREVVPVTMDATPAAAQVRTVTLPSVVPPDANFANVFRANEIHGVVFHDTDSDGTPDPGELRRSGVSVYLDLDRDDICDIDEPESLTGADGSYSFTGLVPGAWVVREKVRQAGPWTTGQPGGGILYPAGVSRPASGNVTPAAINISLAAGETSLHNVSLTLPALGSLSTMVDVFLLFDDTGSFTANSPIVRAAFPDIIARLQTALPGVDLGFGVGRFEEYGSFAGEYSEGRPFTLNQPIVEATRAGFATAIQAALDRMAPGYGGDGPETDIEALYQLVTGLGFDGNNDGSRLGSGPAGPVATQLFPGASGDVPPFASFVPDATGGVLTAAGTIGGAGFRAGALPVILTATDIGVAYQPKGETFITGVDGTVLPIAALTQTSRNTTPFSSGAGLQETVTGLNALGALVIGLGTNDPATVDPRQMLESLARLTGAVNRSTQAIPNGTLAPINPGEPLYFKIQTGFAATVADGVTQAIQNAVTNVAMDITVRASDPRVQLVNTTGVLTGIAAGQTAAFDIQFIGDGRPARFDLQFIRSGTSVVLGSIPVVLSSPIPGDGYQFEDLLDGDIHRSSHFGHYFANTVPVFTAGADQVVPEDAAAVVIPAWATGISPGTADESAQQVQFLVQTDQPGLFSQQPAITADGTLSFTPAANAFGSAVVTVQLQDNGGVGPGGVDISAPVTFLITVQPVNDPPAAVADQWQITENGSLNVGPTGVLANDSDVEGDPLTAILLTGPQHGTFSLNADGSFAWLPPTGWYGTDSFSYVASDGVDVSAAAVVSLTVNHLNQLPVAADDQFSLPEDTILTVGLPGVLVNDSDPDGDPLTVQLLTATSHGSLVLNTDGSFIYTPAANFFGSDSFTYLLSDGFGNSLPATVRLTVTGINDAPLATADRFSSNEDQVLNAVPGVLQNDPDPDGDILTASLVTDVLHGTLLLNSDGTFRYTPNLNYFGEDSFTYAVSDGIAAAVTATVTLTILPVNDAPVVQPDSYTLAEDSSLSILLPGVLGNDADPEGSPLTAVRLTLPARGTLVFNANGAFTYTPATNFFGTDSFTYAASDGLLQSAATTVTFTVTPVNDAPTAGNDTAGTAWNTPVTVAAPGVLTNDRDVDGDPLTAILLTNPAHGTVVLNANGSFTYAPAFNYSGPDSFSYAASDGLLNSVAATVSITVAPPLLVPKFFVVDGTAASSFHYAADGTPITSTPLNSRNTRSRGVATNTTGTLFWVIDSVGDVFVYSREGVLQGTWTPQKVGKPEGIAVWGNDLWLADPTTDRIYKFTGGAAARAGRINVTSSFALNTGNLNVTDMVTDGVHIWAVDDTLATDRVFRYSMAGLLEGSWSLTVTAATPTGIALDPNNVNHLWIVDSGTDRVYQYDAGTTRITGSQAPSQSFALPAGNLNATGIVDPFTVPATVWQPAVAPSAVPGGFMGPLPRQAVPTTARPQFGPPTPVGLRSAAAVFAGSRAVSRPPLLPVQSPSSPTASDLFFGSSLLTDTLLQGLLTGG